MLQVTGAMILTPTHKLDDDASGAVEDTLKACLAGVPDMASEGQRMLAEQTCRNQEVVRRPIKDRHNFNKSQAV